jgi:hypothetical protein
MDDELTPEQRFAAEDGEVMVPRALMQGRSPEDIIAEWRRLDWSLEAAEALVARAQEDLRLLRESPESRQRLIADARRQFARGVWLVLLGAVGGVFNLLLNMFLSGLVGVVVLLGSSGLFCTGLVLMSRGLIRWRVYRRLKMLVEREPEQEEGL